MISTIVVLIVAGKDKAWELAKEPINEAICKLALEKTGLVLDEKDPTSDISLSAALSERSGIRITSVFNANTLAADLSAHASGLIQARTGVYLSNLLSPEQVKADIVGHAETLVQEKTGLNISGAKSYDDVQTRIQDHVREKLVDLVVDRLHEAALDFGKPEATLDELLAMVYRATDAKNLRVRDVVLGTAASLVVAAYADMNRAIKRRVGVYRRRAQNRHAQQRFRAVHGNRMVYDRLQKQELPEQEPQTEGG